MKKIRKKDLNLTPRNISLISFLGLLSAIIEIYLLIVVVTVIIDWLINFEVINSHNHFVLVVTGFLSALTEPVFGIVRPYLPIVRGVDLSPYVIILLLWFIQKAIKQLILKIIGIKEE